jgi:hypothetical protein
LTRVKKIAPPDVFKAAIKKWQRTDMDDPENVFGPAKESPYDAYIEGLEALATQRQPTPPPRPAIVPTARATADDQKTGSKPKPLARATYKEKLARAKAFTNLQTPRVRLAVSPSSRPAPPMSRRTRTPLMPRMRTRTSQTPLRPKPT